MRARQNLVSTTAMLILYAMCLAESLSGFIYVLDFGVYGFDFRVIFLWSIDGLDHLRNVSSFFAR